MKEVKLQVITNVLYEIHTCSILSYFIFSALTIHDSGAKYVMAASPLSDLHVGEEVIRPVESTRAVLDFLAAAAMTEKEKGLSRKLKQTQRCRAMQLH